MALFFDQDWFGGRLAAVGKTHDALAAAAGITLEELAAVWKDQMEVTRTMVSGFAQVLGSDPAEVASRCGLSRYEQKEPGRSAASEADPETRSMLREILDRMDRLEARVATLQRQKPPSGNDGT